MDVTLATNAERLAEAAEELNTFSGLKLLHVKRSVAAILNQIGGNGIFDTYTKHDISHINSMLELLDWIVPAATSELMTPADWLMLVLSIYFHDLGMLVTKDEFAAREKSGFGEYRERTLFAGDAGTDYRDKVKSLTAEDAERFLYQEFVREHHGERVRHWISGKASDYLGIATAVVEEVDRLLGPLQSQFRRDLGLICESHHLDDLDNLTKYKTNQPYGNTNKAEVNLQYSAAILRTADLLHITQDRTPAIVYRLVNPSDPLSQKEWAKQMAVTSVRPKVAVNKDGVPDESLPRDTVEVHAFFKKPNGFFGLTSYLNYAADQLRKTHEWVTLAQKRNASKYGFPWKHVDDSNIETDGFLRQAFEFRIDTPKILDLLTGHTLYNDSTVVLREVVQNALDAVRLQAFIDQEDSSKSGRVEISWNSARRELVVRDNGTGMTQAIIENHLLKVGASRYQDPEFKKNYPGFSSISRFGIGILSTFMIADEVEVVTCHAEEASARSLSLRSVHGRYLIRLLDKESESFPRSLLPHGTAITIRVRASARDLDVLECARSWFIVPRAKLTVRIDDNPGISIGFSTPKEALIASLKDVGVEVAEGNSPSTGQCKVVEYERDGVSVAYAIRWSEYFRCWSFVDAAVLSRNNSNISYSIGTCIEGVRVDSHSPGFVNGGICALANAVGQMAPKTNVARSGLEATTQREQLLKAIYTIYSDHIARESTEISEKRSASLTWAVKEARYLLPSLLGRKNTALESIELALDAASRVPVHLVERNGIRSAISARDLNKEPFFWTIDCAFFRSAEELLREVDSAASLSGLVDAIKATGMRLPQDLVLCTLVNGSSLDNYAMMDREVDLLRVDRVNRRVDMRWVKKGASPRWRYFTLEMARRVQPEGRSGYDVEPASIALAFRTGIAIGDVAVQVEGVGADESAVLIGGLVYVVPQTELEKFLAPLHQRYETHRRDSDALFALAIEEVVINMFSGNYSRRVLSNDDIRRFFESKGVSDMPEGYTIERVAEFLSGNNFKAFSPSAWRRAQSN